MVVSAYVNPTQFGPAEDFDDYPRDLTRDADICISEGVEYLFAPETREMYPSAPGTMVEIGDLAYRFEGESRPGHFRGVATVVLKLFNIVQPAVAAFGWKDAQQAVVVQQLVNDLMLDVELLFGETVRDEDGLAMSSRNSLLSEEQRRAAGAIPRAVEAARAAVDGGEQDSEAIVQAARGVLDEETLLKVDYVELVDPERFEPLPAMVHEGRLLLAVHAGEVRLIDNALLHATTDEEG